MGNMAADNAAGKRINSLLDAGSFVEIGGAVTARTTDFNMQEKETPARRCYHRIWSDRWKSGIRIQPGRYCFKWCDR